VIASQIGRDVKNRTSLSEKLQAYINSLDEQDLVNIVNGKVVANAAVNM